MGTIQLPPDFKEFLKLLNLRNVEYLIVGGYAVGYHGYPRPTGDLDIWISNTRENGVIFADCYVDRVRGELDGIEVNLISLAKLRENKKASGRTKDMMDLENLPS